MSINFGDHVLSSRTHAAWVAARDSWVCLCLACWLLICKMTGMTKPLTVAIGSFEKPVLKPLRGRSQGYDQKEAILIQRYLCSTDAAGEAAQPCSPEPSHAGEWETCAHCP